MGTDLRKVRPLLRAFPGAGGGRDFAGRLAADSSDGLCVALGDRGGRWR